MPTGQLRLNAVNQFDKPVRYSEAMRLALTRCHTGWFALLALTSTACAQAPPAPTVGTLNGRGIPAKEVLLEPEQFKIGYLATRVRPGQTVGIPSETEIDQARLKAQCERLSHLFTQEVRTLEISRLRLTVTAEENEAAVRASKMDPQSMARDIEASRDRARRILGAMKDLQAGQSPEAAYAQHLEEIQMSPEMWTLILNHQHDEKFIKQIRNSAELEIPLSHFPPPNLRSLLLLQKVDQAIDQELGSSDAQFRAAAEKWKTQAITNEEADYVRAKRVAWWREHYGRLNIQLNHPELRASCRFDFIGIHLR